MSPSPTPLALLLVPIVLLAVACGPDRTTQGTTPPEPAQPAASARPGASSRTPAPDERPVQPPSGPLTFTAQEGWIEEPPSSSMRAAQYRLPGPQGEPEATVVVFYFGAAGGGGFEANVARWASQFEQPDGAPSLSRARESSRRVGGMGVREVAFEGTYVAETFPGSGQRVRNEDWALRGAMIEAPVGPYYARLLGPKDAVERSEPSFRAFIGALGDAGR